MEIYNKLVRDNIPEIIRKEGKKPKTRILCEDEYRQELLKKLLEESKEVLESAGQDDNTMKELGDLMEVIDHVIIAFGLNQKLILNIKEKRLQERGGFREKIYLESVE